MKPSEAKPGDWLKDAEGNWFTFVCRRRKKPGVIVLKHMGTVSQAYKRSHRTDVEYHESFLEALEKFA